MNDSRRNDDGWSTRDLSLNKMNRYLRGRGINVVSSVGALSPFPPMRGLRICRECFKMPDKPSIFQVPSCLAAALRALPTSPLGFASLHSTLR
jgi:hypothetical protein